MDDRWLHITKSGERVLVNGKESKELVLDGVPYEIKSVKGHSTWLIRRKRTKQKRIWDEI